MSDPASNNPSGFWKMILLLIIAGSTVMMIAPVSADTGVTIAAQGDKSYYQGEKVVFTGTNSDSDSTYLFIEGPGIPLNGGKLTSPQQKVVSGNSDSFTVVKTKPDKSWEYSYYTYNLNVEAGSYTVYAVSQPKAKDQLGPGAGNVSIILKKPFLVAGLSPVSVSKGVPFTVKGLAEGEPPSVQIWIIGDNYVFNTTTPVNPGAAFTFTGDSTLAGLLPKGQCYLIVQHSMQDNLFEIIANGDYVRNLSGTNLFRIKGAGSLQGRDAAEAFLAALNDAANGDDTYTVIPFIVDSTSVSTLQTQPTLAAESTMVAQPATKVESVPQEQSTEAIPARQQTQPAPLLVALPGALLLILGIVLWNRR